MLEELNEEEKIGKAKWAGIYIIGLVSSLVWLLWILWTEWGFIMHFFTICAFVFLSYQSVMYNAFPIVYQVTHKCTYVSDLRFQILQSPRLFWMHLAQAQNRNKKAI